MKKIMCMILALLLVFSLCACGSSDAPASTPPKADTPAVIPANAGADAPADADPFADAPHVEIIYGSQVAPTHSKGVLEQYLIDTVAEKTNGTVEIVPYWSASLFDSASGWEEVMAGTADATQIAAGTALDHFKIEPATSLFIASADLTFPEACDVLEELYNETPALQSEWDGLMPINWDSSGGELYIMSNVPIRSLEDIEGKTFRYVGDYVKDIIEAFGGIAVKMPLSEVTDSLSKGIIDGTIQAVYNMKDMNYIDVCPYATGLGILSTVCLQRFMRMDKFEEMNAAQQEAFLEAVAMYRDKVETETVAKEQNALVFCEENNAEIIRLTEDEMNQIRAVIDEKAAEKAAELDAAGYDGTGIYQKAQEIVAKYVG